MIALYGWRKRDELKISNLRGPTIDQLKQLLTVREKLIKHRTAYKNADKDLNDCYVDGEFFFIRKGHKSMLSRLNNEIDLVEKEVYQVIHLHEAFANNYRLLLSIRGISKILAAYLIALTGTATFIR
jgi:transposase